MTNLVDIVQFIISKIDLTLPVVSTDGVRVYLCNTLHLTIGKVIEDGLGNTYKITDISVNEWIDVEPYGATVDPFAGEVVICPPITFLHGSPISADNEYLQIDQKTSEKTPFIWLLESYRYSTEAADSSIEAAFEARLFFMEWADVEDWMNSQHNNLAIKPMENLAKAFIDVVNEEYIFRNTSVFNVTVRPRFGVELTDKGSDNKIISEDLSGIELAGNLDVYDVSLCKC